MLSTIYLDYNATTTQLPEVVDAVREASLRYGANPGSQHEPGRQARRALEEAREKVGELLGARMGGMSADQVIFTSGGTEANHLALFGLLTNPEQPADSSPAHLVLSSIEHPSIVEPIGRLENQGWRVDRLPIDTNGVARHEELDQQLRENTRLVCLMLANNETGVIQPVAKAAAWCVERRIALHTDAAQAVGKVPIDFSKLGVSTLSCAAHKFYGPVGIGALIVRHGVSLRPTMWGGHQQAGLRPGTEAVALAVGMRTALECCERDFRRKSEHIASLRDQLEQVILTEIPSAIVIGQLADRLPNTLNIALAGVDRQALVMALDLAGVACSTGSACASGSSEPSPVLVAMGLDKRVIGGAIRLSLGVANNDAEIEEAGRRILSVCKQLWQSSNL